MSNAIHRDMTADYDDVLGPAAWRINNRMARNWPLDGTKG